MIWKYFLQVIVFSASFIMALLFIAAFWAFSNGGLAALTPAVISKIEFSAYGAIVVSAVLVLVGAFREAGGKRND